MNKVSVMWSGTCSNAFKVVFLRGGLGTVSTFGVVATRGPFSAVRGRNDIRRRHRRFGDIVNSQFGYQIRSRVFHTLKLFPAQNSPLGIIGGEP